MGPRGVVAYRLRVTRIGDAQTLRRVAAVLVILAAALWWHHWMPAVIVVAFVIWAVVHTRYQDHRRAAFMRLRGRLWPPAPVALAALIVAGSTLYWMSSASIGSKAMPIALNVLAVAAMLLATWRRASAS